MEINKRTRNHNSLCLTGLKAKKAFADLYEFFTLIPNVFLTYGSCLASHREQEFIKWDTDTDTGILSDDFEWRFIEPLLNNDFKLKHIHGKPNYGLQLVFYKSVKIDLWLFYQENDSYYNCLWDNDKPIKHVYSKELLDLDTGILYNTELPTLTTNYLKHVYGNWQQAQKQFSWKTDHKCIETG